MYTAEDMQKLDGKLELRTFDLTDEDGNKRRFVYDTELMSYEQISEAITFFDLYEKMLDVLPAHPNELQLSVKKQCLNRGLAALLSEVDLTDGHLLHTEYDPNTHTGLYAMKHLRGMGFLRLKDLCKGNFFLKQGKFSIESKTQLLSVIDELRPAIGDEQLNLLIKAALKGEDIELSTIYGKKSTKRVQSKKQSGKRRAQTSRGKSVNTGK